MMISGKVTDRKLIEGNGVFSSQIDTVADCTVIEYSPDSSDYRPQVTVSKVVLKPERTVLITVELTLIHLLGASEDSVLMTRYGLTLLTVRIVSPTQSETVIEMYQGSDVWLALPLDEWRIPTPDDLFDLAAKRWLAVLASRSGTPEIDWL